MEQDSHDPAGSIGLISTIAATNVADGIFDLAEVALDSCLADGLLKDIPVVGSVVSIARARESIRQELAVRQITRFIGEMAKISPDERTRLLERYRARPDGQRALGENLLLAISRLDDIQKPCVLARFFTAYVSDGIDHVTFTRLSQALERFNLALLPHLRWFYTREGPVLETPEEIIHELSLAGLVTVGLAGSGTFGGSANYLLSKLGVDFLKIGFDIETPSTRIPQS